MEQHIIALVQEAKPVTMDIAAAQIFAMELSVDMFTIVVATNTRVALAVVVKRVTMANVLVQVCALEQFVAMFTIVAADSMLAVIVIPDTHVEAMDNASNAPALAMDQCVDTSLMLVVTPITVLVQMANSVVAMEIAVALIFVMETHVERFTILAKTNMLPALAILDLVVAMDNALNATTLVMEQFVDLKLTLVVAPIFALATVASSVIMVSAALLARVDQLSLQPLPLLVQLPLQHRETQLLVPHLVQQLVVVSTHRNLLNPPSR